MTNGEKIQTILDIDRDCTEVYGENGTMTFTITQDFWNAKYKESTVENNLGIDDEERELALMYLEQIKDDYIEGVGYEKHPLPEYYAIETAMKSLALPSVIPQEHRWIPVTERLPENAKHKGAFCPKYYVMTEYGVTEGWYNPDVKCWYVLLWFMDGQFEEWNINLDRGDVPKLVKNVPVTAWMPLPEPYTGGMI